MADFKNKMYQSLISWFAWTERKDRNARGKRRGWIKAEMKAAARKIRRKNKQVDLEEYYGNTNKERLA